MSSTTEKKRNQRRLKELGTPFAKCEICGEKDLDVLTNTTLLEEHHIPGHHEGETIIVCWNCHRKLSAKQIDLPKELFTDNRPDVMKAVAFFMGLGAILALLASLCGKHAMAIYHFAMEKGVVLE